MTKAIISEQSAAAAVSGSSLLQDFQAMGVSPGDTVLLHSSLSSIGWVTGGAMTATMALQTALGADGTLVMPTHTSHISEPGLWCNPRVPADRIEEIRSTMPVFDPNVTPSRGMGVIPESFRTQPEVLRSNHPQDSFAARGPAARQITSVHPLDNGLGEHSPLARLYELDAKILLLGVGHASNTALHLAENRANYPGKSMISNGAPVLLNGARQWSCFQHLEYNVADFGQIGRDYGQQTSDAICSYVGRGASILLPIRSLVDFAVDWMEQKR